MTTKRPTTRGRGKMVKGKTLPFTRKNYILFGLGLIVIFIGYIALSRPPASNFWSLTMAPILLVLGYCVIIPIAIMLRGSSENRERENT